MSARLSLAQQWFVGARGPAGKQGHIGLLQHATSARYSHQYWQVKGNKQAQTQQLCSKAHPVQTGACLFPTQLCSKPCLAISLLVARLSRCKPHLNHQEQQANPQQLMADRRGFCAPTWAAPKSVLQKMLSKLVPCSS